MNFHGPCTLKGPLTQDLPWWAQPRLKSRKRPAADSGVRTALVARVKRQIAEGTYDTPERWEAALDNLARSLRHS